MIQPSQYKKITLIKAAPSEKASGTATPVMS